MLPNGAGASTLLFSFVGPDGSASWTQSSTPTPLSTVDGESTDVPVAAIGLDSFGNAFTDVEFYTPLESGGFSIGNFDIQEAGAQEYTGPETAPVFTPGVYTTDTYNNGDTGVVGGVLTITAAGVPEPSTWLLLTLGFASLGASLRASRKNARVAG